jgi:hypothetical protein
MVSRRHVLLGGVGLVAFAGLGALGADLFTHSEIFSAVRRRLSFLKLDEPGIHAFAKDQIAAVLAKRPTWYRVKYHVRAFFAKPVARYGFSNDKRTRRERFEDNQATLYLLSTDFFYGGADESRPVRYLRLYEPTNPCGNPFWRPAVDTPSAS